MTKKQTRFWQRRFRRLWRRGVLLVVPHRNNHYRPHLVRRYWLAGLLLLVVGLQLGYNVIQTGQVLGRGTTVSPDRIIAVTNRERTQAGEEVVAKNIVLTEAAQAKANDMVERGYWSHTAPDGTEPWQWIDRAGYQYVEAGENLAKNFSTPEAIVTAWMNSDEHRANILNADYQDIGVAVAHGVVDGQATAVVVALYGRPATSGVSSVAGATTQVQTAAVDQALSPLGRVGVMLESLTPAAIIAVMLLVIAATVAAMAYLYRKQLPRRLQKTWYRQHGAIKASGLLIVAASIVLLYGGGQL